MSGVSYSSKKLLLIDGNAIVHRAYHALPELTTPDGLTVNAVYGFFSMFFTVLFDLSPQYVIVAFDRPRPTFRQTLYAGYQQNRPKMADGLGEQFRMLHDALEYMRVQIFEVDGYEADDVIGTIAHQVTKDQKTRNTQKIRSSEAQHVRKSDLSESMSYRQSEFPEFSGKSEVIILTGDRDMMQLVTQHVKILTPIVGVKETVLYDEAKVTEKFGVKPSQFIDYKALIGDSSDGYPGVTGIGPKTAVSLLNTYGTFEDLYQKLPELPPKIAEKLATDAEQAALAKKLATIMTDVPLRFAIEDCGVLQVQPKNVLEIFEGYGFNSLQKRFGAKLKELEERKKGQQLGLL